jgi:hypothetical protein
MVAPAIVPAASLMPVKLWKPPLVAVLMYDVSLDRIFVHRISQERRERARGRGYAFRDATAEEIARLPSYDPNSRVNLLEAEIHQLGARIRMTEEA